MKVYVGNSLVSRQRAIDDIHHKTYDGGYGNRIAVAKSERKAARHDGKKQCEEYYNG